MTTTLTLPRWLKITITPSFPLEFFSSSAKNSKRVRRYILKTSPRRKTLTSLNSLSPSNKLKSTQSVQKSSWPSMMPHTQTTSTIRKTKSKRLANWKSLSKSTPISSLPYFQPAMSNWVHGRSKLCNLKKLCFKSMNIRRSLRTINKL